MKSGVQSTEEQHLTKQLMCQAATFRLEKKTAKKIVIRIKYRLQ